jgi:cobalamin biosynthesis Mg chelatase CobN
MKKTFLLILLSLSLLPVVTFAMTESYCLSNGGSSYSEGICYCTSPRVWAGDGCSCPSSNQVWNGSSCVITSDYDALTSSNCSAIVCVPECDWAGTGTCSTVKKSATYNSSSDKCVCPTGYYSNEASTEGSTSSGSSSSGSSSSGSSSSGSSSSGSSSSGTTTITGPTTASTGVIANPITATSFTELVDAVIKWILDIAMVLAPLVLVYGGLTYITAAGDTSKMTQAKKIIIYAFIGFILALLAKSLVDIFKKFGS